MTIPFRKMHGLGNDFVVLDARALIVYSKTRPSVTGDGLRSLRELARDTATADQLKAK